METQHCSGGAPKRKGREGIYTAILKVLERNPMTTSQLSKAIGFSKTTIRGYTSQLTEEGEIFQKWLLETTRSERLFYRPADHDLVENIGVLARNETIHTPKPKADPALAITSCPWCAVRSDIGCRCAQRHSTQYVTIGAAAARVLAAAMARQHG